MKKGELRLTDVCCVPLDTPSLTSWAIYMAFTPTAAVGGDATGTTTNAEMVDVIKAETTTMVAKTTTRTRGARRVLTQAACTLATTKFANTSWRTDINLTSAATITAVARTYTIAKFRLALCRYKRRGKNAARCAKYNRTCAATDENHIINPYRRIGRRRAVRWA